MKKCKKKLEESKDVIIRNYTKSDYEEVKELMKDLAEIYNTRFDENIWKKAIERRQYSREKVTIVAELDKKVVGVCFVDFHWNDLGLFIGTIKHMMIKKEARGKGIG
ncbi:MAG: GNAT family N-acetyltransferase, partial [Candidatus Helarchaeales archaeon]